MMILSFFNNDVADSVRYASILSEQLSRSERMWYEFTCGERLSGSRQLVSLELRPARDRPQRVRSAVAVATRLPLEFNNDFNMI